MNRFFKTMLLWLLLAALPLQGIAAAMQTAYGPMEHHASAEATMSVQPHHHDGEAMEMSNTDAAGADAFMASAPSPEKSFDGKHKHSSCSACATCCVGAVAPPSMSVSTSACSNSIPAFAFLTPLVVSFMPAGLERPPKRITA